MVGRALLLRLERCLNWCHTPSGPSVLTAGDDAISEQRGRRLRDARLQGPHLRLRDPRREPRRRPYAVREDRRPGAQAGSNHRMLNGEV